MPISESQLQMYVMDAEEDLEFEDLDALCQHLAEEQDEDVDEIRTLIIDHDLVTRTPQTSSEKPSEPSVPQGTPTKSSDPQAVEVPLEDRTDLSPEYKKEWTKWFEKGKSDKKAGHPENTSQLPQIKEQPIKVWLSAYYQGYQERRENFIFLGFKQQTGEK